MTRKILFLGTSHVGSFRNVAESINCIDFVFDFIAFGVPVWRLMLNQSDLVVRSNSLAFDIFDSHELVRVIEQADHRFDLVCRRVTSIIKNPVIISNLSDYCAIVFVDCLFRYPLDLSCSVGNDGGLAMRLCGQPVSFELLSELPNVAGVVTSFAAPFSSESLLFKNNKRTSFVDLFRALKSSVGDDVLLVLWTFPGFAEQFSSNILDTSTDLDLMARVHRHALSRNDVSLQYLQPPSVLLDPISGRVSPKYIGQGFHANDAFAITALQSILQFIRGVVS